MSEAVKLKISRTMDSECREFLRFSGEVCVSDLIALPLDAFDRALLDDCGSSADPADWLLALEMLFRRARQAEEKRATSP